MNAAVQILECEVGATMAPNDDGKHDRQSRGPRDAGLIYAENRLRPWAAWARENRAALGLPTISLLYTAMRQKSVRMKSARHSDEQHIAGSLTARGSETRSMIPTKVGEVPEAIAEVDLVVAQLRPDLHEVIIADYFTYGPIEVRCKRTKWKRARFSQLLEAAKYSVYAGLMAIGHK